MGWIVLPAQMRAIQELISINGNARYTSLDLLWLPQGLRLQIWTNLDLPTTYIIDQEGNIGSY